MFTSPPAFTAAVNHWWWHWATSVQVCTQKPLDLSIHEEQLDDGCKNKSGCFCYQSCWCDLPLKSMMRVNHLNWCDGLCIDCVIMFFSTNTSSNRLVVTFLISFCCCRVEGGGCYAELCVCVVAVSSTMLIESGERSRLHMYGRDEHWIDENNCMWNCALLFIRSANKLIISRFPTMNVNIPRELPLTGLFMAGTRTYCRRNVKKLLVLSVDLFQKC